MFASLSAITILPTVAQNEEQPSGCTVSVEKSYTVQVRVGPGFHRGILTFLPANHDFVVLGKAQAEDETLWWKLDKTDVAPQKQANEVWILQDDVDTSGDCENVPDADEPPIIERPVSTSDGTPQAVSCSGRLCEYLLNADPSLCTGTTSAEIAAQSWDAPLPTAASCALNLLQWQTNAAAQQSARSTECSIQPRAEDLDIYFQAYWALTDVATGYFNLGKALKAAGQARLARDAFQTVVRSYSCAWAWDKEGWFWSLKKAAQEQLDTLK